MRMPAILGALLSLVFLVVACTANPPEAKGEEPKAKDAKTFAIEVTKSEVKKGTKGNLEIAFKPAKGYKWNEAFPSSFTLPGDSKVAKFEKREFARDAFKLKDKNAVVAVPMEGATSGEETIECKANFSVCNDETCLIFRDEKVSVKVAVR